MRVRRRTFARALVPVIPRQARVELAHEVDSRQPAVPEPIVHSDVVPTLPACGRPHEGNGGSSYAAQERRGREAKVAGVVVRCVWRNKRGRQPGFEAVLAGTEVAV